MQNQQHQRQPGRNLRRRTTLKKANGTDVNEKKRKGRKRGKGVKSGVNARDPGASDEEIDKMADSKKEEASVKGKNYWIHWSDEDKEKLVLYMTEPSRWPKITVKLSEYAAYVRHPHIFVYYKLLTAGKAGARSIL